MNRQLAVTWWGHSSATIELGPVKIGTDPVLTDRIMHLRRYTPTPTPTAVMVDIVLVSHLHADHLHVPSLKRIAPEAPLLVPHGAARLLRRLHDREIIEVGPGDHLHIAGVDVEVLPAHHDGRRHYVSKRQSPALGFRVSDDNRSFWYPGDTGPDRRMTDVRPVDLALVPIGGWGPTLGGQHLGPEDAAEAVARVGARWAVPVRWGTFWPIALQRLRPANHQRLFSTPGRRFAEAMAQAVTGVDPVFPDHGRRMVLDD